MTSPRSGSPISHVISGSQLVSWISYLRWSDYLVCSWWYSVAWCMAWCGSMWSSVVSLWAGSLYTLHNSIPLHTNTTCPHSISPVGEHVVPHISRAKWLVYLRISGGHQISSRSHGVHRCSQVLAGVEQVIACCVVVYLLSHHYL